jgi:hypothetical protein
MLRSTAIFIGIVIGAIITLLGLIMILYGMLSFLVTFERNHALKNWVLLLFHRNADYHFRNLYPKKKLEIYYRQGILVQIKLKLRHYQICN